MTEEVLLVKDINALDFVGKISDSHMIYKIFSFFYFFFFVKAFKPNRAEKLQTDQTQHFCEIWIFWAIDARIRGIDTDNELQWRSDFDAPLPYQVLRTHSMAEW